MASGLTLRDGQYILGEYKQQIVPEAAIAQESQRSDFQTGGSDDNTYSFRFSAYWFCVMV